MELSQLSNSTTDQNGEISDRPIILIIDDDEFVRESLEYALQFLGYQTYCAVNGELGIDLYKSRWESVDLVLLDYYMPGMNGEQTFQKLAELNPNLRCIFSSGLKVDLGHHLLANHANRIGFLYKPYDLKLLKEKLNQMLAKN